jgi:hypothetical protein
MSFLQIFAKIFVSPKVFAKICVRQECMSEAVEKYLLILQKTNFFAKEPSDFCEKFGENENVWKTKKGIFVSPLGTSNGKSSIVEERILRFVFVPSIVEERILRFVFVPSIVEEQILCFVFASFNSLGTNKFVILRPFDCLGTNIFVLIQKKSSSSSFFMFLSRGIDSKEPLANVA